MRPRLDTSGITSVPVGPGDQVQICWLVAEDKNLWIASRLIWFDQPRAPEKFFRCVNIQISFKASGSKDEASQTAPVKIGPSS
ncbi:hypothetical protein STEG23_005977 [Scotinomys teguina]